MPTASSASQIFKICCPRMADHLHPARLRQFRRIGRILDSPISNHSTAKDSGERFSLRRRCASRRVLVQHHVHRWSMLVLREREVLARSQPSVEGSDAVPHAYVYGYEGNQVDVAKYTLNYHQYGVLYNFPAVVQWDLCPNGWHVPTDEEWTAMTSSLGSEVFAGIMMKANFGVPWGGTNLSGFSGLPGGFPSYDGGSTRWIAPTGGVPRPLLRTWYRYLFGWHREQLQSARRVFRSLRPGCRVSAASEC